jgi:hypothetical protein
MGPDVEGVAGRHFIIYGFVRNGSRSAATADTNQMSGTFKHVP